MKWECSSELCTKFAEPDEITRFAICKLVGNLSQTKNVVMDQEQDK